MTLPSGALSDLLEMLYSEHKLFYGLRYGALCSKMTFLVFFYLNYTKPSRLDYIWPVESIFQGFQILGLRFQGQKNSELQEGYSYNPVLWGENVMCVW